MVSDTTVFFAGEEVFHILFENVIHKCINKRVGDVMHKVTEKYYFVIIDKPVGHQVTGGYGDHENQGDRK